MPARSSGRGRGVPGNGRGDGPGVRYASARVRILHISTRLILGGSQENTVLSCEGQARLGHEVHLAFGPIFGPEGSLRSRVEAFNERAMRGEERVRAVGGAGPVRDAGGVCTPIRMHELDHLVREISPIRDHVAFHHELRPLVRTLAPDVVHTHSSKAGILGRWAAWKETRGGTACRVVHTIHGPPFMPLEGGVLGRLKVRALNAGYAAAERFAAKRCHTIVSVADAMTREFCARGIGRAEQYVTVRSGVEIAPYRDAGEARGEVRASLGLSHDDFVVGTVARLAQHKGHDDLLDALGGDLAKSASMKLLWVGDGWWRERLVAKARAMGLAVHEVDRAGHGVEGAQVVVTGLVAPERVAGLIGAMDVLAHPSYREGLPRTVVQALLSGVCPVAYDVDGTGEVCREMETGRLVRLGDVEGLGEAVRWCVGHADERRAMGARGRAECEREFDAEVMVARLERVYAGRSSGLRRLGSVV